jgi:hypothetical protein
LGAGAGAEAGVDATGAAAGAADDSSFLPHPTSAAEAAAASTAILSSERFCRSVMNIPSLKRLQGFFENPDYEL